MTKLTEYSLLYETLAPQATEGVIGGPEPSAGSAGYSEAEGG